MAGTDRLIRARSSYDSVILDLGMVMGHETELLRQCDGIYVPVRQDMISRAKLAQWENAVQILGGLDIVEKFQKLEIPENSEIPESRVICLCCRSKALECISGDC